ncbi:MAG: hypothetical protein M3408_11220, partial [Actinomycetota bacterium]|nr:hypothetical protein [Actinomycetota bacterium]
HGDIVSHVDGETIVVNRELPVPARIQESTVLQIRAVDTSDDDPVGAELRDLQWSGIVKASSRLTPWPSLPPPSRPCRQVSAR